jgi:diguanylate cyclase (GGDEF)-like protein
VTLNNAEPTGTAKLIDLESGDNNPESNDANRIPLSRVLTTAIVCVLGLFILVTMLAYLKFSDFRLKLNNITEKSLPSMALSSQVFSNVNSLTYLAESLSRSSSDAMRRIAISKVEAQLSQLNLMAVNDLSDPFLLVQLKALKLELEELDQLVQERLNIATKLSDKRQQMYGLYDRVIENSQIDMQTLNDLNAYGWVLSVSDIIASTGEMISQNRLHTIRLMAEQIKIKLASLEQQVSLLDDPQKQNALLLSQQLNQLIMADTGLISLRVKQLRVTGRVTGRGNFVRNLILDYAGLAGFQSYQINASVIEETQAANNQVKQQIKIIGIVTIVAIFCLVTIAYYVQIRVINRLNNLNKRVLGRLKGKEFDIVIGGNDEISDINQTFEMFAKTIEDQNQILHDLSLSDGLTGIANRRALDHRLLHETKVALRNKWSVSVLLIDVDYFKPYNDKYGHYNGDICLQKIAKVLTANVPRSTDFIARYGGEEFACVLPNTSTDGAKSIAQSLLDAIAKENISHEYSSAAPYVTFSIGIASFQFSSINKIEPLQLLKQADKALYQAKAMGRNRFEVYLQ